MSTWHWKNFNNASQIHLTICNWIEEDLCQNKTVVDQIIECLENRKANATTHTVNFNSYDLTCKENDQIVLSDKSGGDIEIHANKLISILKEYVKICT